MAKFPCRDCDKRKVGCHGFCEEYKKAKAVREAELREEKNEVRINAFFSDGRIARERGNSLVKRPLGRP